MPVERYLKSALNELCFSDHKIALVSGPHSSSSRSAERAATTIGTTSGCDEPGPKTRQCLTKFTKREGGSGP